AGHLRLPDHPHHDMPGYAGGTAFLPSQGHRQIDCEAIMKHSVWARSCLVGMFVVASGALAHDCRVTDGYLIGYYEGGCNEKSETANGHGEAKGAHSYVGNFVNGRLD